MPVFSLGLYLSQTFPQDNQFLKIYLLGLSIFSFPTIQIYTILVLRKFNCIFKKSIFFCILSKTLYSFKKKIRYTSHISGKKKLNTT